MEPSEWSSRRIVQEALAGRPTPRPATGPLAVHYCARLIGVSLRQYTLDAHTLAASVLNFHDRFHPDAIWMSADTWVSAQAMGAEVGFTSDDQPMGGKGAPAIQTAADIGKIPDPDPHSQGRWPLMLEALHEVKRSLGGQTFIVACFDQYPFSLACALMGIDQIMLKLIDDRPMVEALMTRCIDYTTAYATALTETGADMLSGGDSPAGLVGPRLYADVVLPFEQQLIGRIKQHVSIPVSLHICGDATSILDGMAQSGADVLEIDHQVNIQTASRAVGPDVALWGNLDPVGILAKGTPASVHDATIKLLRSVQQVGHRRFVLSSGCTLAVETPAENIAALLQAAEDYTKTGC